MNRLTAILLFAVVFVIGGVGGSMISARSTNEVVQERTQEIQGELTEKEQEIESWQLFEKHILRTQPALEQLQENLQENLEAFIRRDNRQDLPSFLEFNESNVFIHFLKEVLTDTNGESTVDYDELEDDSEQEQTVKYGNIQYGSMFENKEHGDTFIQAVKAYQNRNGLPPDGIIDPEGATSQQLAADIREKLR